MRLGAITGPIVVLQDAHGIVFVQDAIEIWVGRHGIEHHRRIVAPRSAHSHDFASSTSSHSTATDICAATTGTGDVPPR
jgi:hypothetical protein